MKDSDIITDLHCHILPGIDDGAKNIDVTRALLEEEKRQGVTQIAFTPHFWIWQKEPKKYMRDRYNAAVETADLLEELGITWSVGAEVAMRPEILDVNLKRFVYVDTRYLLLEWPFLNYPLYGDAIVQKLWDADITPVFAHIERYSYFWKDTDLLKEYLDDGVLCHINASTVIRKESRKHALKLIKEGCIHFLCSDAHNMEKRPPRLKEAYEIVEKELGYSYVKKMLENADAVFHGREL